MKKKYIYTYNNYMKDIQIIVLLKYPINFCIYTFIKFTKRI